MSKNFFNKIITIIILVSNTCHLAAVGPITSEDKLEAIEKFNVNILHQKKIGILKLITGCLFVGGAIVTKIVLDHDLNISARSSINADESHQQVIRLLADQMSWRSYISKSIQSFCIFPLKMGLAMITTSFIFQAFNQATKSPRSEIKNCIFGLESIIKHEDRKNFLASWQALDHELLCLLLKFHKIKLLEAYAVAQSCLKLNNDPTEQVALEFLNKCIGENISLFNNCFKFNNGSFTISISDIVLMLQHLDSMLGSKQPDTQKPCE